MIRITYTRLSFRWLAMWRALLGTGETITRDNATWSRDGDWELWRDYGETVG